VAPTAEVPAHNPPPPPPPPPPTPRPPPGGHWKDLTDKRELMAPTDLPGGHRTTLRRRWRAETYPRRIPSTSRARLPRAENTINTRSISPSFEVEGRASRGGRTTGRQDGREGGREGRVRHWKDLTDNVNSLDGNLTAQVRNNRQGHHGAWANGDLSRRITSDARGEILARTRTINTWRPAPPSIRGNGVAKQVERGRWERRRKGRASRHLEGPHRQSERPRRQTSPAGRTSPR